MISLLGGVVEAPLTNPPNSPGGWRDEIGAGMLPLSGPADRRVRRDPRERLMVRCGLDRLERMAEALDLAYERRRHQITRRRRCRRGLVIEAER